MRYRRLSDSYRFPGFRPKERVVGIFGDPGTRVVRLVRTGKKLRADIAVNSAGASTTTRLAVSATYPTAIPGFASSSNPGGLPAKAVER